MLGFNTTFVTVLWVDSVTDSGETEVSIQLLLLFYDSQQSHPFYLFLCFNTTFVTVLFHTLAITGCIADSFNTTFVTVLFHTRLRRIAKILVSIQLLLLFYYVNEFILKCQWVVSIQLLLLFYPHFYWFLILLYHKISPKNQDFLNFLPT